MPTTQVQAWSSPAFAKFKSNIQNVELFRKFGRPSTGERRNAGCSVSSLSNPLMPNIAPKQTTTEPAAEDVATIQESCHHRQPRSVANKDMLIWQLKMVQQETHFPTYSHTILSGLKTILREEKPMKIPHGPGSYELIRDLRGLNIELCKLRLAVDEEGSASSYKEGTSIIANRLFLDVATELLDDVRQLTHDLIDVDAQKVSKKEMSRQDVLRKEILQMGRLKKELLRKEQGQEDKEAQEKAEIDMKLQVEAIAQKCPVLSERLRQMRTKVSKERRPTPWVDFEMKRRGLES